MANTKFDAKSFNPQAFGYLVDRVPNMNMNELVKSRALKNDASIANLFKAQDGTVYARTVMRGLLDGEALNYDGVTDITATSTKTFERGVVVIGRGKAWVEKDFSYDVTAGKDFMDNVAEQVAQYWDTVDQNIILAILDGIFSMTGAKNLEFVNGHTTVLNTEMTATTLNSATNKACGANKKKFTMIFMHSNVSTNLENLNLIQHLKYTDKDGVTRDLELGTWNGRVVIVDDNMPVTEVEATYKKTTDTALVDGKTYYTRSGSASAGYTYTAVETPSVSDIANYYEVDKEAYTTYTTYVLGDGAIDYADIGAKVPHEMDRNPAQNGGEDTLYTRRRKVFAPRGISYEKASQATNSPDDTELRNGANWSIVHSGEANEADRSYYSHKAIPIARIISRG